MPYTKPIMTRSAMWAKANNAYKAELAKARAEHEEGMEYLRGEVAAGRQPRSQLAKAQKRFQLEVKAIREKIASNMSWPEYNASSKGKAWAAKDRLVQIGTKRRKPVKNSVKKGSNK